MVCRRDAENKLLSFPQDDCKEKMKDEFVFFESNQASNQWCGEVMTNLQKKKENLQPLKQSAWITQWDFNLFKFYFSKTKAGGIVLSWLSHSHKYW